MMPTVSRIGCLLLATIYAFGFASAQHKPPSQSEWSAVERIVAVGDVHGDFRAFQKLLRETGIINARGRWIAGKTHLVQVGDVPDRGPDSRKAMDLLMKLEKQALKAGGRVHALIGNHEAMNIAGDLRYVDPGEYKAFVERRSRKRQQLFYENTVEYLKNTLEPENLPVFDDTYKAQWLERYPLGYVEHRQAWSAGGKYGRWVGGHNTIVKINDTLFVHGGISPEYQDLPLDELNASIRRELADGENIGDAAAANDPLGPLWYRGLSQVQETCEIEQQLKSLLSVRGAKRIVVAHTPTAGAVLARYGGKLVMIDVGLSRHYGGARAALIIEGQKLNVMHEGELLEPLLPASAYLDKASKASDAAAPLFARFMKNASASMLDQTLECALPDAETP